jgi:dUTP pyrophosphatase
MNKDLTLFIEKIDKDSVIPDRATPNDTGIDLVAHSFKRVYQNFGGNGERLVEGKLLESAIYDKAITLSHFERVLIGTGLKVTIGTPGYDIQIRPRSGLALKKGLTVLNTPGTIDVNYKDELCVILVNLSRADQEIKLGERIAQLVVAPCELPKIEVVPHLPTLEDRGGGFGSTGV